MDDINLYKPSSPNGRVYGMGLPTLCETGCVCVQCNLWDRHTKWNRTLQAPVESQITTTSFFQCFAPSLFQRINDCPCLIKSHLLVVKSQLVSGFKHFGGSLFAMIPTFVSRGIETTRGSNHGHHGADARTSKAVRSACHDDGNCLEHRASQDL